ncbi:MAG: hypothetical protein OQK74_07160 [Gammaproteobacteria bacterium]|jgi:hypothetical protein|nr:hypothetical protein [Thermoanaerobaculales bacterium]MCW9078936.1 hypothetical protein [Gammaproteobacteria bacterium]
MNKINIKRMLLAGLAMFVMWIAIEILLEGVIADLIFGRNTVEMLAEKLEFREWTAFNYWVNMIIPVLNCTLLIWLYASLRPMYGVGARTVLITSAFCIGLGLLMFINFINLGLLPVKAGLIEAVFEAIEFPIAMMAGAAIYEGQEKWDRPTE